MLRYFSLRRITSLVIIVALLTISVPDAVARSSTQAAFTSASILANSVLSGFNALIAYKGQERGMPSRSQAAPSRTAPKKPSTKAEREARVAKLEINSTGNSEIEVGERALFMAIPLDENGSPIHGLVATWESDNPEVITIEKNGEALAGRAGTANLKATAGNKRETVKVSVIEKAISSIAASAMTQQTQASTGMRAHANKLLASMLPQNQLPETEYRESLYSPQNMIGEVPGKTTPGASVAPAAVSGTEMPGSSNFNFDIPVVDLPGRGLDVNLSLVYNSRLWSKSTTSTGGTRMTYNIEKWQPVAPGFQLNFGQLRVQGGVTTYIEPNGTRHDFVSDGNGGSTTNDGSFIHTAQVV